MFRIGKTTSKLLTETVKNLSEKWGKIRYRLTSPNWQILSYITVEVKFSSTEKSQTFKAKTWKKFTMSISLWQSLLMHHTFLDFLIRSHVPKIDENCQNVTCYLLLFKISPETYRSTYIKSKMLSCNWGISNSLCKSIIS